MSTPVSKSSLATMPSVLTRFFVASLIVSVAGEPLVNFAVAFGGTKATKACSIGCPSGSFEASPCSTSADRVCIDCTECRGSSYEAKPCGGSADRQCTHAAYPLLNAGDMTIAQFLEEVLPAKQEIRKRKKLKIDSSSNVHIEDLHSSPQRDAVYRHYVTDSMQASDFVFNRDSGLRINVGISSIQLIPEYIDVDHQSDNSYMLTDPHSSEDRPKFRSVMRDFCRHPIPDYYSITLEISQDRTTATREVICNTHDPSKPRCPPQYKDGDVYIYRTPNDACPKLGTYPEPLVPAANSIVCTDNTALLRDVFNQTFGSEQSLRFPPKKCRTAASRCEQCVRQSRCVNLDALDRKCCQIDCYTLIDCKTAYSSECTSAPVECAMGGAYRFTIQPVFENIKSEHQCHIRRHRPSPEALYKLFYSVQLPSTGFESTIVHKTIRRSSTDERRGRYNVDFLMIEHDAGLDLQDEYVLSRREFSQGQESIANYTVYPVTSTDASLHLRRPVVHEISPKIYVASAQFERPFDYSTSTWTRRADACSKNTTKVRASLPRRQETDFRDVNVAVHTGTEPFRYLLKSVETQPYIHFTIPGNASILKYCFHDNGPVLYVNDSSFATSLELTSAGSIWEINIRGRLSGCPGYLGITISSWQDQEELIRNELLVLCPAEFNVTFRLRNWNHNNDRGFQMKLEDSHQVHHVYLTQLTFEPTTTGRSVVSTDDDPVAVRMVSGVPGTRSNGGVGTKLLHGLDGLTDRDVSVAVFTAVGVTTVVSLIAFVAVYVYVEAMSGNDKLVTFRSLILPSGSQLIAVRTPPPPPPAVVIRARPTSSKSSSSTSCGAILCRYMCVVYVAFRLLYSIVFTLTAVHLVVTYLVADDVTRLAALPEVEQRERNDSTVAMATVNRRWQDERRRIESLANGQRKACANYVGELFDSAAAKIDAALEARGRGASFAGEDSQWRRRRNESISGAVDDRLRQLLSRYAVELERVRAEYRDRSSTGVSSTIAGYRKYLVSVFTNDWLSLAQRIFNESSASSMLSSVGPASLPRMLFSPVDERLQIEALAWKGAGLLGLNLTGLEARFGNFMELQEVEEIQMWAARFWERFNGKFPRIPDVPSVADGELEYQCRHSTSTETQSTSKPTRNRPTPLDKLDHVLFFTSYQQKLHGNLFSMPNYMLGGVPDTAVDYSHEYRLVSSSSSAHASKSGDRNSASQLSSTAIPVFSVGYVTEGIDGDLLRTVFLILDVLILIYRMTRTCWTVRLLRRRYARCRCEVGKFSSRIPRCGIVSSDSGSVNRFAGANDDGGNMTSTSFRSGRMPVSESQFQMQQCCHGDAANIYTDPQTLSIQTKVGNNARTSTSTSLQRTAQQADTKRMNHAYSNHSCVSASSSSAARTSRAAVVATTVDHQGGSPAGRGYRSVRSVFGHLLENSAVPKAIVACVVFLVLYSALRVAVLLLDVDLLLAASGGGSGLGALGVYVDSLSTLVNETNVDARLAADTYNDATRLSYVDQLNVQLVNIQSLVEYFNTEQKRLNDQYANEICNVLDKDTSATWGCDLNLPLHTLTVPVLPCHFIAIEPQVYSGFHMQDYRRHLVDKFEPFIVSARRIVLTSGYAVVLAMSAILALHVVGWTTSRCLQLRVLSSDESGVSCHVNGGSSDAICSSTGVHRPQRSNAASSMPVDGSVQTFVTRHGGRDLDDVNVNEDDDPDDVSDRENGDVIDYDTTSLTTSPRRSSAMTSSSPRTRRVGGGGCVDAAPSQTATLRSMDTGDFKYSETNV